MRVDYGRQLMKVVMMVAGLVGAAVMAEATAIVAAQSSRERSAVGTSTAASEADPNTARIVGAAMTRGGALEFLRTLTDSIGGRVTGSKQSQTAAELILKTLKEAGYGSARIEEYPLESRWERGPASGEVLAPGTGALHVGSFAWVPGTAGRIEAGIVDLGAPPTNALPKTDEELKGAAVIVDVHAIGNAPAPVMRALVAKQLARAGAAAMLIPSDKPGRMLYTSAYGLYPGGPLPVLSIGKEDAAYLRRLKTAGPVKIALDIRNKLDKTRSIERNVIAEIPGSGCKEIVLVGAHFDSWDPAQGADDNGTGVSAVLETARILKALGITPRCTIRFAFFSGEEEANLGSRAYAKAHAGELDRTRAFLLMDSGAQTPLGFVTNGREDLVARMKEILSGPRALGATEISTEADMESDNATFMVAGVPSLTLKVAAGDYEVRHHAITDTFENVDPHALAWDTAVIAIAAYEIATAESRLGHRQSRAEVKELLRKTGLESAQEVQFGPIEP
jgi:carboxypeptidase Q